MLALSYERPPEKLASFSSELTRLSGSVAVKPRPMTHLGRARAELQYQLAAGFMAHIPHWIYRDERGRWNSAPIFVVCLAGAA